MKKQFLFVFALLLTQLSQAQWEHEVRLTEDPASSYIGFASQNGLAVSGHYVHVAWWDDRNGNNEIYYKRSTDDGNSWGDDVRLTYNDAESSWSSIAVLDSAVHVVWVDKRDGNTEIYYKRSTDRGVNWETDIRLTNTPLHSEYTYPCLAVSGSCVHVAWEDSRDGNYEIYYKCSTDGGGIWDPDTRLTYNSALSAWPAIAVSCSLVHVIWFDARDGNDEIYYKRSTDEGSTWEDDIRLTNDPAVSYTGSIAVSDSAVHVVWQDARDGFAEIFYKRSLNGGLVWGPDKQLTDEPGDSHMPSIKADGNLIHMAWYDHRDENTEIYYKCSTDAGEKWGEDMRLTFDPYDSYGVSLALSDSAIHVVWQDNRDGNYEIYYISNPTGNIFVGLEGEPLAISSGLVKVFPNPAGRQLTVGQLDSWTVGRSEVSSQRSAVRISIVDLFGREVKEYREIPSSLYQIDISDLADGVYFLRIMDESGKSGSVKFVKGSD